MTVNDKEPVIDLLSFPKHSRNEEKTILKFISSSRNVVTMTSTLLGNITCYILFLKESESSILSTIIE